MSNAWNPVPGKVKEYLQPPKKAVVYKPSTKAALNKRTKTELVDEIVRLQTLVRSIAIAMGITPNSKTGECVIDVHFADDTKQLIKAGWSLNL